MKNHIMRLHPSPMKLMREGTKTVELRLYDEKRKQISVGDRIAFANAENETDVLQATVLALYVFASFDELYKSLPLSECGYTKDTLPTASPRDMDRYYPKEKQKRFGVVGVKVKFE